MKKSYHTQPFSRFSARAVETLEQRRMLATLVVDLGSDTPLPVGDGQLTLREAVSYVNGGPVAPGDLTPGQIANLGNNDRIEIDVPVVSLDNGVRLTQPATIAPHAGRDVSIVFSTPSTTSNSGAIVLSASRSGGISDFHADSTFVVEDLRIAGFTVGVTIAPNPSTAGANPQSAVLRNNRIEVTTGTSSTIGVSVVGDEIPFKIEGNIITGPGIETGDFNDDIGIAILGSPIGPGSVAKLHSSLVKDNEIAAIERGMLIQNVFLPNLEITGGVIGSAPSDPQWSGAGVGSGITVIGDANGNAPPDHVLVGRIATTIESVTGTAIQFTDSFGTEIVDSVLRGGAGPAVNIARSSQITVQDSVLTSDTGTPLQVSENNGTRALRNTWRGNTYVASGTIPVEFSEPPSGSVVPNDPGDIDSTGPNNLQNHVDPVVATPLYLGTGWEVPIAFDASQTGDYAIEFYSAAVLPGGETVYEPIRTEIRNLTAGSSLNEPMFFAEGASGWDVGESLYSVVTAPDGSSSELAPVTGALSYANATPRVTNVVFAESSSGTRSVSMDALPRGGQLTNLANLLVTPDQFGVEEITIHFDQAVDAVKDDLTLVPLRGTNNLSLETPEYLGGAAGFELAGDGLSATWTLDSPLASNQYVLWLRDDVTAVGGGPALNGDWANPTTSAVTGSPFAGSAASGNQAGGGDFQFAFTHLGNANFNFDNAIDLLDLDILGANWGLNPADFGQGDANGDGTVDLLDLDILGFYFGIDLTELLVADLNDDDVVDTIDRALFDDAFALGTSLDYDFDNDGDIDSIDKAFFDYWYDLEAA